MRRSQRREKEEEKRRVEKENVRKTYKSKLPERPDVNPLDGRELPD